MKQLIASFGITQSAAVNGNLLNTLQDIADKIEIQSNFCIRHPDYKPLELPEDVVTRFQKMPEEMQHKYMSLQLRSFLYGIYYNGSMQDTLALDTDTNNLPLDLENNTLLGVDIDFYQQLHQSNCSSGYFDPGWSILQEETDKSLAVTKANLRLHIERDKHLQETETSADIGDLVSIYMPKNRVQNGFYVAVGNAGIHHLDTVKKQALTVRIYFNLSPEGAVAVMSFLTQKLNEIRIPFSFKVLYNPQDYKRHDSGVLYFDKRDYKVVKQVLQTVYQENQLHFKPKIPLFTMQLAPGLGLAEEPNQKFATQESFGMNRCQIVANGLLTAWKQGENSSDGRMKAILEQFDLLGIDLQHVYLNANSENIYTLFEL
ncbi:MAG: T3SS effector HopA1 family protein [Nostocaceae cyanobacterium]|nr:T3SS effector HopA1 family protein [Nostocaceae cyanobacterium]